MSAPRELTEHDLEYLWIARCIIGRFQHYDSAWSEGQTRQIMNALEDILARYEWFRAERSEVPNETL